jgi:hypothetical protein
VQLEPVVGRPGRDDLVDDQAGVTGVGASVDRTAIDAGRSDVRRAGVGGVAASETAGEGDEYVLMHELLQV